MDAAPVSLEALRAALGSRAAALAIEWVAETGSTNADLLGRVRAEGFAPSVRARLLVAGAQTAGRGRHGRRWHVTPGASLAFSLAWPMATTTLSGLSLAVGVAVAEAIDPAHSAGCHVGIKWPNDLWLAGTEEAGRKLGGILIETTPIGNGGGRVAVIGVGLNVLEQRVSDASSGVAWLRELDAAATPTSALERIVPALLDALGRFDAAGFTCFAARFAARDLLRGRSVRCSGSGEADGIEGVALGVSASGELRVRTARGVVAVGSGEVSVRLAEERASAKNAEASC